MSQIVPDAWAFVLRAQLPSGRTVLSTKVHQTSAEFLWVCKFCTGQPMLAGAHSQELADFFDHRFTAHTSLLTVTSAFGLERIK